MNIAKILAAVLAVLGLINLIMGFLNALVVPQTNPMTGQADEATMVMFQSSGGPLLVMLFAAGLIALGSFMPKGGTSGVVVLGLSVAGALGILFMVISSDHKDTYGPAASLGAGAIMGLIFGLVQMFAAIVYWLADTGMLGGPRRPSPGYGQGYGGPQGYPGQPQGPQQGQGGYGYQGPPPGQGGYGQGS